MVRKFTLPLPTVAPALSPAAFFRGAAEPFLSSCEATLASIGYTPLL